MDERLQIIPLGGLGEFGMNCMALRYGDDIIVVDAGMMFPDAELMGVDIVTPDFAYLEQNSAHVRALVLTHGHEDHIGAIPFLLSQISIPVYGTAFTLALVERRLEEHEMVDETELHAIKPGEKLELGPFSIEFIHVTHSIVSCVALAITTPLGVIIHTGDYKVDPTPTDNVLFDLHTLAEYGKRGVLLLLSDSTNVDRAGYTESERAVGPRLEDLFVPSPRRLALSSRIIPGTERAIYRMINHIARRGADVVYGTMNPPIHVSGHGSAEELRLVLNLVRPKYFVPVHGEYRQLAKHAQLAQHLSHLGLEETFILESGQTLELDHAGARPGESVPVARVFIHSGTLDERLGD